MDEKVKVVRCKNCVNWDGMYCRSADFVKYRLKDGKKTNWETYDFRTEENDYCSFGAEGDYEPWGANWEEDRLRK